MSFRGRLTLFFLLIVVVPMVTVAVLVAQVIDSARSGKADARLAAGLETAMSLYRDDVARAGTKAERAVGSAIGIELGQALDRRATSELEAIAGRILRDEHLASVQILDPGGRVLASAGAPHPIAVRRIELTQQGSGASLGSLAVSSVTPDAFLAEVRRLTGRTGAITGPGGAMVARNDQLSAAETPGSGHSRDVEVGGETERAASARLPGPGGLVLTLVGPEEAGGSPVTSPAVIAALVAFIVVALLSVIALLRTLQGQVAAMLGAARAIGDGDFTRKVPVMGRDEMAGLASEFNKMSERLAQQMSELRRQRDELERSVRRVGAAFVSGLDREALLQIVVETALEACHAEYGRVAFIGGQSPGTQAGRIASVAMREAIKRAEADAVAQAGTAEAQHDDCHALSSVLWQSRDGAKPAGVMTVARRAAPFEEGERDLFLYLAGQASASIENVALHELVSAQAVTDELTGLSNNRHFREWVETEAVRANRFGHELSLLMLDVDDFKQVNDTYGHLQGDEVLRMIGRVLREESRNIDEPARYGGEEFVVGLPETGPRGAKEVADRIRSRIEAARVPMVDGSGELAVTASVGVASMPAAASDVESLIAAADGALYAAKRAGKNRVEVSPGDNGAHSVSAAGRAMPQEDV